MKFSLIARLAASAAALAFTTCMARAQDAGPILVYNAQHVTLTQEWVSGFTKETGIKVTLRNGGDMELGNQIVQEGANSPADVFLTENSPGISLVNRAGLLSPLPADTLALVPENYRPSDGHWIGIAARTTAFAYNKSMLKPDDLPKSMLDLADARWKGRWGASPSGADFQAIISALVELKGEGVAGAWLKSLKTNAVAFNGNTAALKGVNAGQIAGAIIFNYYWFGDQAKTAENSKNVALHFFRNQDPGAFISISGAGVLATSKKQAQAQAFVKYIAGKAGQDILRTGTSFEYAVGVGAASNPSLPPLAELQGPKVDPAKLNSKTVTDLMIAAGLL